MNCYLDPTLHARHSIMIIVTYRYIADPCVQDTDTSPIRASSQAAGFALDFCYASVTGICKDVAVTTVVYMEGSWRISSLGAVDSVSGLSSPINLEDHRVEIFGTRW